MAEQRPQFQNVHKEIEEHDAAVQAARDKKWTYAEIQEVRKRYSTPTGDPALDLIQHRKLQAMEPLWEESHRRGDFLAPGDPMTRQQAQEFYGHKLPMLSTMQVALANQYYGVDNYERIRARDPLTLGWQAMFKQLHQQKRVCGPTDAPPRHFENESEESAKQWLENFSDQFEAGVKARAALAEAVEKVGTIQTSADRSTDQTERQTLIESKGTFVSNAARTLVDMVKQTSGTEFDARNTSEFSSFDRIVESIGGSTHWQQAFGGDDAGQ